MVAVHEDGFCMLMPQGPDDGKFWVWGSEADGPPAVQSHPSKLSDPSLQKAPSYEGDGTGAKSEKYCRL